MYILSKKYLPNMAYNTQKSSENIKLAEVFSLPSIISPLTWNITEEGILVEVPVCLPLLSFIVII